MPLLPLQPLRRLRFRDECGVLLAVEVSTETEITIWDCLDFFGYDTGH